MSSVHSLRSNFKTKNEYMDNLLAITMQTSLNMNIWDCPLFLSLQVIHTNTFGINLNSALVTRHMLKRFVRTKKTLIDDLRDRRVHLTLDVSTHGKRSILGVGVHFIRDWKSEMRYLGLVRIPPETTVEALQFYVLKCLLEYGVEMRNVFSMTTDSDVNCFMEADMTMEDWAMMDAPATERNIRDLVGSDDDDLYPVAQTKVMKLIEEVVAKFGFDDSRRCNNVALDSVTEFLAMDQRREFLKQEKHLFVEYKNKPAKWRGYHFMCDLIHTHKQSLEHMNIDWAKSSKIYTVLKEMDHCTRILAIHDSTPGDLVDQLLTTMEKLKKLAEMQPEFAIEAKEMISILEKKINDLLLNIQFEAAVYLDPRFVSSNKSYFPPNRTEIIKNYLLSLRTRIFGGEAKPSFDKAFLQLNDREEHEIYDDFLIYWSEQDLLDKEFVAVAEVVLALPASQAPADTIFKQIHHVKSNEDEFMGKTIDEHMFVKLNCFQNKYDI